MESLYYDFNKLLDEVRSDDLYVIFTSRGNGKNVITKVIKAVNLIEQIYKTKISVYRDEENNSNLILCGLVCGIEIKVVLEIKAFDLSVNQFVYATAHKFSEIVAIKLFMQEIK